jgi:hypothetical protein
MTNMGDILGISGLTSTQEAAIVKIAKYYLKAENMIKHYSNVKNLAIARYSAFATNTDRVDSYTTAWAYMPANYKAKITAKKDRLIAWVLKYLPSMFNYKFPEDPKQAQADAERIVDAIFTYLRKQGVSIS